MTSEQARPTTCPNCHRVYDPSRTTYCDKCGQRFPWAAGAESEPGLMVVRLFVGFAAALVFGWVGFQLLGLPSASGEAGAFYDLMGWFSFGMGLLAIAIALPRESSSDR